MRIVTGVLAAAALVGLDKYRDTLEHDHAMARRLSAGGCHRCVEDRAPTLVHLALAPLTARSFACRSRNRERTTCARARGQTRSRTREGTRGRLQRRDWSGVCGSQGPQCSSTHEHGCVRGARISRSMHGRRGGGGYHGILRGVAAARCFGVSVWRARRPDPVSVRVPYCNTRLIVHTRHIVLRIADCP